MAEKVTLKLLEPIQAHGETVATLTFRPPVGRDMRKCGQLIESMPDARDPKKVISRFSNDVAAAYISELAGIPMSSVDHLSADDFTACIRVIDGFFGGGTAPSSSDGTSTVQGSSAPLTSST